MEKLSGQLLWDYCEDLVANKAGYVWGARGEVYTVKEAKYLLSCYKTGTYNELYYMTTQMKRWGGKIVVDCSGLIQGFRRKYGDKKDNTAQGLYEECGKNVGTIDTLPTNLRGVLVFKKSGKKMGHVGVYGGDNTTIEAYSSEKGVIKSNPMKKSSWTHWGILPFIEPVEMFKEEKDGKEIEEGGVPYTVTNCTMLNIRAKAASTGKQIGVLNKGDLVFVYAEKNGWCKIDKDEEKWCSKKYLKMLQRKMVVNCSALSVRNKPTASGKRIATLKRGDYVYVFGVADTGWIKIDNDTEKYCSFKYLQDA